MAKGWTASQARNMLRINNSHEYQRRYSSGSAAPHKPRASTETRMVVVTRQAAVNTQVGA